MGKRLMLMVLWARTLRPPLRLCSLIVSVRPHKLGNLPTLG